MPSTPQRITPMLWFDDQAEQAVALYTSIFKNSKVLATTRYTKEAEQAAGRPEGSVAGRTSGSPRPSRSSYAARPSRR